MDLFTELSDLTRTLDRKGVAYGLCGGLALAVHGHMRATQDIDLLVLTQDLDKALEAARELGFTMASAPMPLAQGAVDIHRVLKPMGQDEYALPVDFILVSPQLEDAWSSIQQVPWRDGTLRVLSPNGLRAMKQLRMSTQDKADLEALDRLQQGEN